VVSFSTSLQISEHMNRFSTNLYNKMAEVEDGNIMFSPFSLHTALSMAMEGSKNGSKTHQELAKALYSGSSNARLLWNEIVNIHYDGKGRKGQRSSAKLEVANKVFADQSLALKTRYKLILKMLYRSSLQTVDFKQSTQSAADTINAFVDTATHGLIKEIIRASAIDPTTRLMLINAIYFKANWKIRFDESMTRPMTFKVRNGLEVECQGMYLPKANFKWAAPQGLNAEVLELPYDDPHYRMLLILPNNDNNIEDLDLNHLDDHHLDSQLRSTDVSLKLPKFKVEYEEDMNQILKNMGITDMFKINKADFTEIANEPIYVSQVKHKAVIEVNEQGSEAAAVTSVAVTSRCLFCHSSPRKLRQMIFDKPFLFVIQDVQHNIPLFIGRITDPNGIHGLATNVPRRREGRVWTRHHSRQSTKRNWNWSTPKI